jgi:branched-subunit amino acid ABC-type transport system permease component
LQANFFQAPTRMDFFLQLLFTGIGVVYALVALGFVLIFRATSVVIFAQGEFSMVAVVRCATAPFSRC